MASNVVQFVRPDAREVSQGAGLFLRPGYAHSHDLLEALAAGHQGLNGVVLDASCDDRQQRIREKVIGAGLEVVLDTQSQQLATVGGRTATVLQVPWAGKSVHKPDDLRGQKGIEFVRQIASFAIDRGCTAILVPTHFIQGPGDPWLEVDRELTLALRVELDRRGYRRIDLFYSLAMAMAAFRQRDVRTEIIQSLENLPIDQLWLRISRFGQNATGVGFSAYVDAMRDMKRLDLPIVAEYVGGLIGLALLAFGEVSGIAHGITIQESFDEYGWRKKRSGGGGIGKRVYIRELDIHLSPDEAKTLFGAPGAKSKFVCHDTSVCPYGAKDMLDRPGSYFAKVRIKQVADLLVIPPKVRAAEFMEKQVRPITDHAAFAVSKKLGDPQLEQKFDRNRRRLDRLRPVLGALADRSGASVHAKALRKRVVRDTEFRPDRPSS